MTDAALLEAVVSAYVLTCLTRSGRRPSPDDVATFRMYAGRALTRGAPNTPPPPPTRGGDRVGDGDGNDDEAITQPSRPHARPPR